MYPAFENTVAKRMALLRDSSLSRTATRESSIATMWVKTAAANDKQTPTSADRANGLWNDVTMRHGVTTART